MGIKKDAQLAPIPEAERPYAVPANWRWARLGDLLETSKEKTEDFSDTGLRACSVSLKMLHRAS